MQQVHMVMFSCPFFAKFMVFLYKQDVELRIHMGNHSLNLVRPRCYIYGSDSNANKSNVLFDWVLKCVMRQFCSNPFFGKHMIIIRWHVGVGEARGAQGEMACLVKSSLTHLAMAVGNKHACNQKEETNAARLPTIGSPNVGP